MDTHLELEKTWHRKEALTHFEVGDTIEVGVRIQEGNKERIQVFSGVVLCRRGRGLDETFTVRRIVQGEGVERIFPTHSPKIAQLNVKSKARVRRAKLYYLRDRTGKGTRLKERIGERPAKGTSAAK